MADHDDFERLMIRGLTCSPDQIKQVARAMIAPSSGKVAEFAKHMNAVAMETWLIRARGCLKDLAQPGETGVIPAGSNNQQGKDLAYKGSGRQIELKSGPAKSQTAANAGIGPMAWYFGDTSKDDLYAIMSTSMGTRRSSWRDAKKVEASKKATIDALVRYFADHHLRTGQPAPAHLSNVLRAVALGFTTRKAVEFYLAHGAANGPLLLEADPAKGLVPFDRSFRPHERIIVTAIRRGPVGIWIHFEGEMSHTTVRLGPNWKNDDKSTGVKILADNWVSHPCFHFYVNEGRKV